MSDVFIITRSGLRFDILEPTPDMVCIEDIAHALAAIPRFNGHTAKPYTVAQHSVLVASWATPFMKLTALMHDAAEAYIGDITGPLKRYLGEEIKEIEERVELIIARKFGLIYPLPSVIKEYDLSALATERRDLIPPTDEIWPCLIGIEPFEETVEIWSRHRAYHAFIGMFHDLAGDAK